MPAPWWTRFLDEWGQQRYAESLPPPPLPSDMPYAIHPPQDDRARAAARNASDLGFPPAGGPTREQIEHQEKLDHAGEASRERLAKWLTRGYIRPEDRGKVDQTKDDDAFALEKYLRSRQPAETSPATPPSEIPPAVTGTPVPTQDASGGIGDILKQLEELFPARPTDNPAQARADAEAEKERQRTHLLARLAFASGLTAAGGAGWDQIGKGFAGAADTYDQGFARYHKALQASADRAQQAMDTAYEDKIAKTEAAVKLYTTDKALKQSAADKKNALLMDSLKLLYPEIKADEFGVVDPNAIKRREEIIRRSLHHGRLVDYDDVAD